MVGVLQCLLGLHARKRCREYSGAALVAARVEELHCSLGCMHVTVACGCGGAALVVGWSCIVCLGCSGCDRRVCCSGAGMDAGRLRALTLVAVDGEVVEAAEHGLARPAAVEVAGDVLVVPAARILTNLIKLAVLTRWRRIGALVIYPRAEGERERRER